MADQFQTPASLMDAFSKQLSDFIFVVISTQLESLLPRLLQSTCPVAVAADRITDSLEIQINMDNVPVQSNLDLVSI